MSPVDEVKPEGPDFRAAAAARAILVVACVFASGTVFGQGGPAAGPQADWTLRHPPGSIRAVDGADRALADAARERVAIETRFAAEEQACFSRFFVNNCTDGARERRRAAIASVRAVEIEANAVRREARLLEREKLQSPRPPAPDRVTPASEFFHQERGVENPLMQVEDRTADIVTPAFADVAEQGQGKRSAVIDADRAARVAAYMKKTSDAQARQRLVEARKAEKERKRLERRQSPQ